MALVNSYITPNVDDKMQTCTPTDTRAHGHTDTRTVQPTQPLVIPVNCAASKRIGATAQWGQQTPGSISRMGIETVKKDQMCAPMKPHYKLSAPMLVLRPDRVTYAEAFPQYHQHNQGTA